MKSSRQNSENSAHPNALAFVVGCVTALALLGIIEAGFRIREYLAEKNEGELRYSITDFITKDQVLGAVPRQNVRVNATKTGLDNSLIYSVDYAIDNRHRRVVPDTLNAPTNQKILLLFGCSFMFGEGLRDEETLAHFLQEKTGYRCTNYAFIGYGPQQMLTLFRNNLVELESGYQYSTIYGYMGEAKVGHIDRAIGSLYVFDWTRFFPYFHFDETGGLQQNGNFVTGRPMRSRLYSLVRKSAIVTGLGLNWPIRIDEEQIRLTATIMKESMEVFRSRTGSKDFYVINYPGVDAATNERFMRFLRELQIECIDLSQNEKFNGPQYRIPGDGHPSGAMNREIAEIVTGRIQTQTTDK